MVTHHRSIGAASFELLADLFDGLAPMMDDRIPVVSADLSRVEITDPARS